MSALVALPYSGGGDARVSGKLGQVAVTRPGVALWISLTAGALALGLGAGTAWWFAVGRDLEHAASLRESADDVVFTGDDLHFFLLGEKSLAAAGLPTALEPISAEFTNHGLEGPQYDPVVCGAMYHSVSGTPAGARSLFGRSTENDVNSFYQEVVQFPTVDEAIEAFETVSSAVDSCSDYQVESPGGEDTHRATARSLMTSDGVGPAYAVMSDAGQEPDRGWVLIRTANVITVASIYDVDNNVTDARVAALALAVHERAVYATAKKRTAGE